MAFPHIPITDTHTHTQKKDTVSVLPPNFNTDKVPLPPFVLVYLTKGSKENNAFYTVSTQAVSEVPSTLCYLIE